MDMPFLPPRLSVELTARCNYACPFCYGIWHEQPDLGGPELSTAEWGAILANCARRGVRSVQFTGGEPLLRTDLDELCDLALAVGLKVAVYTNASLLTKTRLLSFRRRRIRLSTTLQGLTTHAEMTGTGFGVQTTLEAIALAKAVSWPMGVGIPVTRANAFEVAEIVSAALRAGAATVQVGPAMWEGRMKTIPDAMLDVDAWMMVKTAVQAIPSKEDQVTFVNEFFCACRAQSAEAEVKWPSPPVACPAGRAFGALGITGHFRRCLHALS